MSFTTTVKQELNHVARERGCCRTAELAALFRASGSFHLLPGERYGLEAAFGLSATARTGLQLVRYFNLPVEVRVREERRLGQRKRYELYMEGGSRLAQFLNEIGVLSDRLALLDTIPQRIIKQRCCQEAFLRGAFLASGSVSEPGSAAHLEIYSGSAVFLGTLQETASSLGLKLSLVDRRRNQAVYAKSLGAIRDFLVATGAHESALNFEQRAILSSVREGANRRANCDQANAARCSRAAARQIRAINRLRQTGVWKDLTPNLMEAAELRLRHPSSTIVELGGLADPPLSKSAVNHRLRRLVELAGSPA